MIRIAMISFCLTMLCLTVLNAQDYGSTKECEFLRQLKFKNGRDTITIKAVCVEVGKVLDKPILKRLETRNTLKEKDFGYSLFFKPLNCQKIYGISSSDNSKEALAVFHEESVGKIFTIRCIVFKGIEVDGRPFFVIDRIQNP